MTQRRVLVVEDDKPVADAVRMTLELGGYKAWTVGDGQQALSFLHDKTPDLVIMDVNMPLLSGLEVCKTIKRDAKLKAIKVVLLTGRFLQPDKHPDDNVGADVYLLKPVKFDDILATVNRLLK